MSILKGPPVFIDPKVKENFAEHFFKEFEKYPDHVLLVSLWKSLSINYQLF